MGFELPKHLKWEKYEEMEFLSADYTHLSPEDIKPTLNASIEYLEFIVDESNPIYHLVNIQGTQLNPKSILEFSTAAKQAKPYLLRTATIGVSETQFNIVHTVGKVIQLDLNVFLSRAQALSWLFENHQ